MNKRVLFLFIGLCLCFNSFAQMQVRGIVTDIKGDPIPGVTVLESGTQNGVITNIDGQYSISVKGATAVLQFSFVGMETKDIVVGNRSTIDVVLNEVTTDLDELIVVGYGTMRKSDVSGAISSVRSDALQNIITPDAAAALQGKASGVQVLTNSGAPGQGASIRVRGYSSNSGQLGPLLIVDGLQVDNIQYLDPSMIESIEILKDAASAAIYGAQAGNGVVLVTTKSGAMSKGTSSITYDVSYANQSLARHPEIFRAKDFIEYKKMSGLPIETQLQANNYNGTDTDWFDVVFAPSWNQKHTMTFQGGNNQGNFFTSINYVNNDGIVRGDKDVYKRLSAQLNADYNIKKWLQVGTNTSIEKWSTKSVPQMTQYGSVMNSVLTLDPLTPAYYSSPDEFAPTMKQAYDQGKIILKDPENGLYYATSKYITDDSGNPLLQRDRVDAENKGVSIRGLVYQPKLLRYGNTSRLGYRIAGGEHRFSTPYYATPQAKSDDYNISANVNTSLYYQFENFANYNITLDQHAITAMGGMSYIENNTDNVSTSAQGPDILTGYEPNFRYMNYVKSNMVDGEEKTVKSFGNLPGRSAQISYFGRLIYTFDNRYTIQANFRADAFDSSKLPATKRWGYFPSFSAGWNVSNEKFFTENINTDSFSFLRLRASYGYNGNINVLNNYAYSTTISYNSSWYQYGVVDSAPSYGSKPSGLANPNLKWETSEQLDLGLK